MSVTDPNAYPVELPQPDLAPYADGNTGIPYYTSFTSTRPGPHVLVNALVHGNELCGAIAIDHLFRAGVRPKRGILTLGFSNMAAYHAFDVNEPMASRFVDEDFNRVWDPETLEGDRQSVELTRAREMRPLIDTVDFMLDIHSMQHKTRPLMMAGPLEKARPLARDVGTPGIIIADQGHAAGRRLRDYGGFGDASSPKNALLVECGQHWEAQAAPIAIDTAYRWLMAMNMIDEATASAHLLPLPDGQRIIEVTGPVTVKTENFVFAEPFTGLETLASGELIGRDGDEEVRAPFDDCVLVMPSRRLTVGATAVRLGRWVA